MVKDYALVQIVHWGGVHAHRQGEYGKWMLIFFVRDLHNAYVVAEYEVWPSMLSKKLAMVKDYVIVHCANNQLGGEVHTDRGGMDIGC